MFKMNSWGTVTLIVVLLMIYGTVAGAASFDCAKAQTQLEKTICNDNQLNDADTKLGKVYFELMDLLSGVESDRLKQEQRSWLKSRTNYCSSNDARCLYTVYEERIKVLQANLSALIQESQPGKLRIENISQKIHESLPLMDFKIYWNDDTDWTNEIVKIEIYNSQNAQLLQQLTNLEESYCWAISFDDYNFDGFLDFRLSDLGAILGNVHGDVYLFDPKTDHYTLHKGLSNLTSIHVDHEKKRIYSDSRSRAGMVVTYETLTFTDDKLVVLFTRETLLDDEGGFEYLYISDKVYDKNGELKMTGTKKVKVDDLEERHFPIENIPLGELP